MKEKTYKRAAKLNQEINSLRDDKAVGKTTVGIFLGFEPLTTEAGEIKRGNFDQELFVMQMQKLHGGEIEKYWADAGIRGTFKMARIQAGQAVEIVHTGKKEIEQGTVQTYDVFGLEQ